MTTPATYHVQYIINGAMQGRVHKSLTGTHAHQGMAGSGGADRETIPR